MPDSLILIDVEGKISAVNMSLIKLLGYEEDELHGKPADGLFTEKLLVSKILEKMNAKGEVKNFETKFKTKSDEEIDVILSASIVRDKQEKMSGIVAVVHDITKKSRWRSLFSGPRSFQF